jgi:glycosyltransferase involved in cell wall biosynthesis
VRLPLRPLALLPPLGGSLSDLRRHGQLSRVLDYYLPAYLEHFPTIRHFSYEPERIEDLTGDPELRKRVEIIAPKKTRARHRQAIAFGIVGRRLLRTCSIARVLHAPGAVPSALASVPFVCTYGYSYASLTRAPVGGMAGRPALAAKRALVRAELQLLLRRAAVTIATSEPIAAEARAHGAKRVALIPNGVDVALFAPSDAAPEYDVTFVGRLTKEKGLETLAQGLAQTSKAIRVCVVGEGPERSELVRAFGRDGITCDFLGTLPNSEVADVLARSSCFVLPSVQEGNPKALLEAMAAGVACIASDIPAVRAVAGRDAVLLFPVGDHEALASLLRRALGDSALRERIGRAARDRAVAQFDLSRLLRLEAELLVQIALEHGR